MKPRINIFAVLKKEVDYIIVGQGIAGTILGFQMQQKGLSFVIVDKGFKKSSSYVAAGLINPIVLKRLTKAWRAEEFAKYNDKFYNSLNAFFNQKLYTKTSFKKLISSEEEKQFWPFRFNKEDLSPFIEKELKQANNSSFVYPFLEGSVKATAWLNIKPLLASFRQTLIKEKMLLEEAFNHDSISFLDSSVTYKSILAKKIIFCEGAKIINNPFFKDIPMSLNKGELLSIKSDELNTSSILKKKVFVLPIDKSIYKIGATFEWNWENENPSKEKKNILISQFKEISTSKFEVINHEAGVRPSVKDRRPIIGLHKKHRAIGVFNGLGSRGCFSAPLLAEEFLNYLECNTDLNNETKIERYYNI